MPDSYICAFCGGPGCFVCDDAYAVPEEFQQTPEEEAQMIAQGMLYLTTKLAEAYLLGER